jgi:hypothetical protein
VHENLIFLRIITVVLLMGGLPISGALSAELDSSVDSAFRTFDSEIPKCQKIRDGVMPALKAKRTAFI